MEHFRVGANRRSKVDQKSLCSEVKKTRPDENPQGFQELREAYETCLRDVEYGFFDQDAYPEIDAVDSELVETEFDGSALELEEQNEIEDRSPVEQFIDDVFEKKQFNDIDLWESWLLSDTLLSLVHKQEADSMIFWRLYSEFEKGTFIQKSTLQFLNGYFEWTSRQLDFTSPFLDDKLEEFFDRIEGETHKTMKRLQKIFRQVLIFQVGNFGCF